MKKIYIIIIISIIALSYLGYAGSNSKDVGIQTKSLTSGTIQDVVRVSGFFEAKEKANVMSEVSGTVEEIYVTKGDFIEKGEAILKIDTENLALSLNQLHLKLKLNELEYKKVLEKITLLEHIKEIYTKQKNKTINAIKYIENNSVLNQERINLQIAKFSLDETKSKISELQIKINKATVIAPFDGYVRDIYIQKGSLITENSIYSSGTRLVSLIDNTVMTANILVNEIDSLKVSVGDKVEVSLASSSNYTFDSRISYINFGLSEKYRDKGNFIVAESKIENVNNVIKEGVSFRGKILIREEKGLIVNQSSVMIRDNKQYVYLLKDGKYILTEVSLGISNSDQVVLHTELTGKVVINPTKLRKLGIVNQ